MSRSRLYKQRQEKKRRKLQFIHDRADCQYAKIILSENKKFKCINCRWFSRVDEKKEDWYWSYDYCNNKYRVKKGEYRAELPEEKFCGFFEGG